MKTTKIKELEAAIERIKFAVGFMALLGLFALASVGYGFHLIMRIALHQ